nr:sugar nucleotide-binding protein [Aeromonas caviae]
MRILLLGARGQLGRALCSALCRDYPHWQVTALGRAEWDMTCRGSTVRGGSSRSSRSRHLLPVNMR